jgi:hypothetical protein
MEESTITSSLSDLFSTAAAHVYSPPTRPPNIKPHSPPSQHLPHLLRHVPPPHCDLLTTALAQDELIDASMQRQRFIDLQGIDVMRDPREAVAETLACVGLVGWTGGDRVGGERRTEEAVGLQEIHIVGGGLRGSFGDCRDAGFGRAW